MGKLGTFNQAMLVNGWEDLERKETIFGEQLVEQRIGWLGDTRQQMLQETYGCRLQIGISGGRDKFAIHGLCFLGIVDEFFFFFWCVLIIR